MNPAELDDLPNPFATPPRPTNRWGGLTASAVAGAARALAMVAIGFVLMIVCLNLRGRWNTDRLGERFASQSVAQKLDTIERLSAVDSSGLETLCVGLLDPDPAVARAAAEALSRRYKRNQSDPGADSLARHQAMVEAIDRVAERLPDDRTGWAMRIVQPIRILAASRSGVRQARLRDDAADLMEKLSLSNRSGPSILTDELLESPRLLVRPRAREIVAGPITEVPGEPGEPKTPGGTTEAATTAVATVAGPRVYRSGPARRATVRMRPVESSNEVALKPIAETASASGNVQRVAHLMRSPLESLNDRSVIHWLADRDPQLREAARSELVRRGFTQEGLADATDLAGGDVETRLAVIERICHRPDTDPRPWLAMMLGDDHREVRLRVISKLATIPDPSIQASLRLHLASERDPVVAARLRRLLGI